MVPGVHAAVCPRDTAVNNNTRSSHHGAYLHQPTLRDLLSCRPFAPRLPSRAVLTSRGRDGRLMSWTVGPRRVLLRLLSGARAEPTGGKCPTPPNWSATTSVGSATRSTGPVGVFRLKSFHLGVLWVLTPGADSGFRPLFLTLKCRYFEKRRVIGFG